MVILPSLPQKGANPSMYIEYENVFLGIYMIYLSLLYPCTVKAGYATKLPAIV